MFYDKQKCLEIVYDSIQKSLAGQAVENFKLDFKRKWYDLKTGKGENDFIKDTSAIANTFGLDGLIIIGYDDKDKSFYPAKFADCGYNDTNYISQIISRRISRSFTIDVWDETFNEHSISIIHIPPSIDKPHIMRKDEKFNSDGSLSRSDEQRIYVRNGSNNKIASQSDIELMIYDRKNVIPEYKIETYLNIEYGFAYEIQKISDNHFQLNCPVTLLFENLGRRPIFIQKFQVNIYRDDISDGVFQLRNNWNYKSSLIEPGALRQEDIILVSDVESFVVSDGEKKLPFKYQMFTRSSFNYATGSMHIRLHNGDDIISSVKIVRRMS